MLIKWAHLSDIHHMYKNYETTVMRDKLFEYLETNKNDVDYLFITGDVADKGSEYNAEVFGFLDNVVGAVKIAKSEVFMIPGNHDIKRDPMTDRLATHIIGAKDVRHEVNNLDEGTYQALI